MLCLINSVPCWGKEIGTILNEDDFNSKQQLLDQKTSKFFKLVKLLYLVGPIYGKTPSSGMATTLLWKTEEETSK